MEQISCVVNTQPKCFAIFPPIFLLYYTFFVLFSLRCISGLGRGV